MFKIQKKIDVHQLKSTLWNYLNPRVRTRKESRPESSDDKNRISSSIGGIVEGDIQMSQILADMYYTGEIDKENVTVNSAFICMLHLANEKCLEFIADQELDFRILQD